MQHGGAQLSAFWYLEGWDGGRWEGGPRGRGYIYIYIQLNCTAETNTAL